MDLFSKLKRTTGSGTRSMLTTLTQVVAAGCLAYLSLASTQLETLGVSAASLGQPDSILADDGPPIQLEDALRPYTNVGDPLASRPGPTVAVTEVQFQTEDPPQWLQQPQASSIKQSLLPTVQADIQSEIDFVETDGPLPAQEKTLLAQTLLADPESLLQNVDPESLEKHTTKDSEREVGTMSIQDFLRLFPRGAASIPEQLRKLGLTASSSEGTSSTETAAAAAAAAASRAQSSAGSASSTGKLKPDSPTPAGSSPTNFKSLLKLKTGSANNSGLGSILLACYGVPFALLIVLLVFTRAGTRGFGPFGSSKQGSLSLGGMTGRNGTAGTDLDRDYYNSNTVTNSKFDNYGLSGPGRSGLGFGNGSRNQYAPAGAAPFHAEYGTELDGFIEVNTATTNLNFDFAAAGPAGGNPNNLNQNSNCNNGSKTIVTGYSPNLTLLSPPLDCNTSCLTNDLDSSLNTSTTCSTTGSQSGSCNTSLSFSPDVINTPSPDIVSSNSSSSLGSVELSINTVTGPAAATVASESSEYGAL